MKEQRKERTKDLLVAAFIALQASPISSRICAFCSCKTALSGMRVRAASHFPSASRYFPFYKAKGRRSAVSRFKVHVKKNTHKKMKSFSSFGSQV